MRNLLRSVVGEYALVTILITLIFVVFLNQSYTNHDTYHNRIAMDDHWNQFVSAQHYFDSAVHSGSWPLWNPYSFCGQPFAGHPGARIFYPPNMIRSMLNSNPTVLSTVNSLV
ncbi:MAG: hypothetical protein VCD00_20890, partial [Candidatus Hydrogenedentota bacterium]